MNLFFFNWMFALLYSIPFYFTLLSSPLTILCPSSSIRDPIFHFASVRRSQSPPPAGPGQLWCQSTWRSRRRWEKQGELFTQLGPSVPLSVCPRKRDPGPGQREQAHPIQVSWCVRVFVCVRRASEERRGERKCALNKVRNWDRKQRRGYKRPSWSGERSVERSEGLNEEESSLFWSWRRRGKESRREIS